MSRLQRDPGHQVWWGRGGVVVFAEPGPGLCVQEITGVGWVFSRCSRSKEEVWTKVAFELSGKNSGSFCGGTGREGVMPAHVPAPEVGCKIITTGGSCGDLDQVVAT